MGKPTDTELKTAIEHAAKMREQDQDPQFIAKALLNYNYRCKALEKALQAAERFLHSGMGSNEHRNLVKAINDFHALDRRSAGEDDNSARLY